MEVKAKVFKRKTGKSKGTWIIRLQYFDEIKGRTCYVERHAAKRTDAVDERDRLVDEIKRTHGQIQTGDKLTFQGLVDIYKQHYYKPAEIVGGRKVAGVRSYRTVQGHLAMLTKFFGNRMLRHITYEGLIEYRVWRLKQGSQRGSAETKGTNPVSIATVNRELSSLRAMMSFAFEKGWILKELSFKKIIDADAEQARDRILTPEEEIRLLDKCQGTREIEYTRTRRGKEETIKAKHDMDNPRLKAAILLAVDSGMRKGEILKSEWSDYDFVNSVIVIRGTTTKTGKARKAPLSERAAFELQRIRSLAPNEPPFPFNNFAGSFETACRLAKIEGLQFRDLRTTAITRWQEMGIPMAFAGKMAGHTQIQTTMKHYTAPEERMVAEAAKKMSSGGSK